MKSKKIIKQFQPDVAIGVVAMRVRRFYLPQRLKNSHIDTGTEFLRRHNQ